MMPIKPTLLEHYIIQAEPFANEILIHLQKLVHKASNQVVESIKWGFPHFSVNGHLLCHMAAFKNHCSFGFWRGIDLPDPDKIIVNHGKSGMGHLGKIKSLKDLPSDETLLKYLKNAIEINAHPNHKKVIKSKPSNIQIKSPNFLLEALKSDEKAKTCFTKLSKSNQKEYIEWLLEAKTETTRQKRMATALEWMKEGKSKNWKYAKK